MSWPLTIEVIRTPAINGVMQEPRDGGTQPADVLQEQREVRDGAEERESDHEADRARHAEDPVREQRERQDRLGRASFDEDERDDEHDARNRERDHSGRAPGVGRAAEARVQHDRREAAGKRDGAEVVDPVLDLVAAGVERGGDDRRARAARSGTLTKKIQRHDRLSTKKPPSSGPMTVETPNTPPK